MPWNLIDGIMLQIRHGVTQGPRIPSGEGAQYPAMGPRCPSGEGEG